MSDILSGKWVNFETVCDFVHENVMTNNTRFVLDNWDCKYINIRVDMRTGIARLSPGNVLDKRDELQALNNELLEALENVRKIICDGAEEGFNPLAGDWAEQLFKSNAKSTVAINKARGMKV